MNDIQSFNFAPGLSVRAINQDGQSWFVASEICKALGLINPSQSVTEYVDPEDKHIFNIGLPGKAPLVVNESGMYALILGSRKPAAKAFQRWVTSTVLPALRQSGVYVVGQEKVDLASMSYNQAAAHIDELKARVSEAEAIRWEKSREDRQDYRDAMHFFSRRTRTATNKLPVVSHCSDRSSKD